MAIRYSLRQHLKSEEIHIGDKIIGIVPGCVENTNHPNCLCGKVSKKDTMEVSYHGSICMTLEETRIAAADIGELICGGCAAVLYSNDLKS